MIIKCPECGKEISDKAKFCIHCGLTLNEAASSVNKNSSDAPETKIEYKEIHSNGRVFHYINDSSKPLCPHCHKPVDWVATMCSNCNGSLMEKSSETMTEKSLQNTAGKSSQNIADNTRNTYNTYNTYSAPREEKDTAFDSYNERQRHEQYIYVQYSQNQNSKPEGKAIAALVLGICGLVFCFWRPGPGLICAIVGACLGNPYTKGVGYGGKIMSWISIITCCVGCIVACGIAVQTGALFGAWLRAW